MGFGGDNVTVGQNIKVIRKEKGITQKKLSELTGLAEITIRQYEADKFIPKIQQVEKIASALNVTPFDIMGVDYFDATANSEQLQKDVSIFDTISSTYGHEASEILNNFLSLNDDGKQKASDYISDLVLIYKK